MEPRNGRSGGATRGPATVVDEATGEQVEIRRSARRVRTVSAYRRDGRIVVLVPARLGRAEEREWVARMVERVRGREAAPRRSDVDLATRATELSRRYLAGRAVPTAVTWSSTQQHRWGSCTALDGTIRISERARRLPDWVLDYIVLHELAHLVEPSHSSEFWALLVPYRLTERARGYLEGFEAAGRRDDG